MNSMASNVADLVGRIFIAALFLMAGLGKLGSGYASTQAYMEAMGVPGELLPMVIAVELLGGLVVMLGWHNRVAAFLLAGFSLLSAIQIGRASSRERV